MDVTSEEQVQAAFEQTALTYDGVDIIVNNAGLATSSPFAETTLKEWELNMNVLGKGYLLVAREAMETHLARCIAAEGGEFGNQVNSVLPEAVLQGSAIWGSRWREERAAAYGIEPDQLGEHYRKRTTLLVIPDYLHFLLTGKKANEYTNTTSTQCQMNN